MQREIIRQVRGQQAIDGAGVHLSRVLALNTVKDFDPFLMLDSFDSTDPADYIAGFPMHPHRGIETITYLIQGEMDHKDSLGNAGRISSGQSQWMTAGSGILHEEMPRPTEHLLGVQLWLNLPAKDKMATPRYFDITEDMIGVVEEDAATLRVIAGDYKGTKGVQPHHLQATYYDVSLTAGKTIVLDTSPEETVFVFLVVGDGIIQGEEIFEKTAVLFGAGDFIKITAPEASDVRFLFLSAPPLGEEVAWGGPIVMNTREELQLAFQELDAGTFIKHDPMD